MSRKKKIENENFQYAHIPRPTRKTRDFSDVIKWVKEEILGKVDDEGKPLLVTVAHFNEKFELDPGKVRKYAKEDGKTVITEEFESLNSGAVNALRKVGIGINLGLINGIRWAAFRMKIVKKKR